MRFVPPHSPPDPKLIDRLCHFISASSKMLVLTGAGLSTESGLPDYRSEMVGLYARTDRRPMEYQTFIRSEDDRKRYWARSFIGWPYFSRVSPNLGHHILSDWGKRDRLFAIVTQNVDRLHHGAGLHKPVTELHGTSHEVVCLQCGHMIDRSTLQEQLISINPFLSKHGPKLGEQLVAPDGDIELPASYVRDFQVRDDQLPILLRDKKCLTT